MKKSWMYIAMVLFLAACQDEESFPPQVRTAAVSAVTHFSASVGGEILNDGGAAIVGVGLIVADNPEFSASRNIGGYYSGNSFSASATGLQPNTLYYAKAWAKNEAGTGYGEAVSFTTEDAPPVAPTVSKVEVSEIAANTAKFTVSVNPNGAETTLKFQCTVDNQKTELEYPTKLNGRQETVVVFEATGLKSFADYKVEAKATNSAGSTSSLVFSMFSTPRVSAGTVTDIDGNVYNTVVIGDQIWMVENLKVTRYRNGDPIANLTDRDAWTNATSGAYCWYNNDQKYKADYGALYNQYATVDSRGLAPQGWHVPSDEEWRELEKYIKSKYGNYDGGVIKEKGIVHWKNPNAGAKDIFGFSARGAGIRVDTTDGERSVFGGMGEDGAFWTTSMAVSKTTSWARLVEYDHENILTPALENHYGLSVRCVKN